MTRKQQRAELTKRIVFVGCSFCGAVDRPLRNVERYTPSGKYEKAGKICFDCWEKEQGVQIGHRKEDKRHD